MFGLSYKQQKMVIVCSFLLAPLFFLTVFSLYPAGYLIYLSLTDWDGISKVKEWVGFANYRDVFRMEDILNAFSHNLIYLFWGMFQIALGLFAALIVNSRLKGRNMYRVILFMPYIMNGVAVAYMFNYVYHTEYGSLNAMLRFIGLDNLTQSWFGSPKLVNHALAFISVWKYTGFNMVIFLAALQSIPSEMIEAARIDGAKRHQIVWHIILPNLITVIELLLFLTIIGSLEVFDLPFLLTAGGPLGASETFVTMTVDTAFEFANFGLASAMSTTLMAVVTLLIFTQRMLIKRWES